jgi:Delta7-sterol 5-desaturase
MDIVLEILDTFIFDRLYAQISPTSPNTYGSLKSANATTAGVRELPSDLYNNFHYRPATQYFSLEPSKWAYMTSWQRDDPLRQLVSLYLITWYVDFLPCPYAHRSN